MAPRHAATNWFFPPDLQHSQGPLLSSPNPQHLQVVPSEEPSTPSPLTQLFAVPLCDPDRLQVVVQLARLVQQPQGVQGSLLLAGLAGVGGRCVLHLAVDAAVAGEVDGGEPHALLLAGAVVGLQDGGPGGWRGRVKQSEAFHSAI